MKEDKNQVGGPNQDRPRTSEAQEEGTDRPVDDNENSDGGTNTHGGRGNEANRDSSDEG